MWFLVSTRGNNVTGENQPLLQTNSSSFGTTNGLDVEKGDDELTMIEEVENGGNPRPSNSSSLYAVIALGLLFLSFIAVGTLSINRSLEGVRYFEYNVKSTISHLQSMFPVHGKNTSNVIDENKVDNVNSGRYNNEDHTVSTNAVANKGAKGHRNPRCKLNRLYHTNTDDKSTCEGKIVELVTAANKYGKWPVGFSWTLLQESSEPGGGSNLIVENGPIYADTLNGQNECDTFVSTVCLNGDYVLYSNQDESALNEFNHQMMAMSEGTKPIQSHEETFVDLCGNGNNKIYSGEAMDFSSSSITQLCAVDFNGPKNDEKYVVHHLSTSLSYAMNIDQITHEQMKASTSMKELSME